MDFDKPKVYGDTSITDGLVQPWKKPLVDRVVGRLHGGESGGAEDGLRAAGEAQQGQLGRQVFLHLEVESCMTLLE